MISPAQRLPRAAQAFSSHPRVSPNRKPAAYKSPAPVVADYARHRRRRHASFCLRCKHDAAAFAARDSGDVADTLKFLKRRFDILRLVKAT